MKENYEAVIIFDPKSSEIETDKLIEKIKTIIKDSDGEIIKLEKQGRKKFAYKIKGRDEGNFVFMNIKLDKDKVETIEKSYRLTDLILRYSIIRESKYKNNKQTESEKII